MIPHGHKSWCLMLNRAGMARYCNCGADAARERGETPPELEAQRRETTPIPGRDGWRRDSEGREWYSAEWLGRLE